MTAPAYPLGIDLMDTDHARIEAILGRAGVVADSQLDGLHQDLMRELAEHFSREESLMLTQSFPGLHCHRAQHKLLLDQARGAGVAAADLRRHLAEIVVQLVESHILSLDVVTAAFLKGELGPSNFESLRLPLPDAPQ